MALEDPDPISYIMASHFSILIMLFFISILLIIVLLVEKKIKRRNIIILSIAIIYLLIYFYLLIFSLLIRNLYPSLCGIPFFIGAIIFLMLYTNKLRNDRFKIQNKRNYKIISR